MQLAANVVYRDVDSSRALNDVINKKLQKLTRFSNQIHHSRVVLDSPHKHKHKGKCFRASIELDVKGSAVTVHQDDPSIHVAVREVFHAAERKLKELADKNRQLRHSGNSIHGVNFDFHHEGINSLDDQSINDP